MALPDFKVSGEIGRLVFARPPVNAFDADSLRALVGILEAIPDSEARAVVLTGEGGCFTAGLDIKSVDPNNPDEFGALLQEFRKCIRLFARSTVPFAAAISGHCLGAGAIFASLCDYRVMDHEKSSFGLPEIKLGMEMPAYVFDLLCHLFGQPISQRMYSEGMILGPEQAHRYNIADTLAPAGQAETIARRWCAEVLELPARPYTSCRKTARAKLTEIVVNGLDRRFQ